MSEPAPAGALDILLLEDSAFDAELLRAALERSHPGARFTWVKDEAGFTAALGGHRFDVVLSDYQLPGFSGAEALASARALAPGTPFIFVSGVIGEENAVELLKIGATDYVIKGRLSRLPVAIERALREVRQEAAQRRIEGQLRAADALYARVVDSLQDHAVVLLDLEGRIRQWNRASGLLFGRSLEQVRGASADILHPPEDQGTGELQRALAQALEQGSSTRQRWMLHADGRRWRAESVITPLYDDAGAHSGFSAIVRDVTPAYQASEALRQAKEEAERANELKDQFLAVLSHELRTPLSAITGWADILTHRGSGDPVLAKASTVIRRNAQMQARMIDDLLDMSAVIAGKLALDPAPFDLAALVGEIVLSQLHGAQAKGVALQVEALAAVPLQGDAQRLSQVVTNLVANAVKFTEAGGRIDVQVRADGPQAVIQVRDTGCGISAAFLPCVFDRLRQEDGSTTRRAGGLGLGLAIARAIVELHDGTIEAHSDGLGRGATFTVRLPRLKDPAQHGALTSSAPRGGGMPADDALKGLRILLVDDEEDAREVGQVALTGLGAQVRLASSAGEAMEVLRGKGFDVLVSDIGMPGMDGLSLMRKVRGLPGCGVGELATVALTAFAMLTDRQAGRHAGFQAYVAKPIALAPLADAVRSAVADTARAAEGARRPLPPSDRSAAAEAAGDR